MTKPRWPRELKQWDAVYVEWNDTVDHTSGTTWEEMSSQEELPDDMKVFQAGLVFKVYEHSITLVSATDKDNQIMGRLQIPKSAITKIKRLKV